MLNKDGYFQDVLDFRQSQPELDTKLVKEQWLYSTKEKNLVRAMSELKNFSLKTSLPREVMNDAARLHKKAIDHDLARGRSVITIMYACTYLACKMHNLPRTVKDITKYSKIDQKEINRACKLIRRKLNIKLKTIDLNDYLMRFASRLSLSATNTTYAEKLLNSLKDNKEFVGKNPLSVVAGIIYFTARKKRLKISQKDVVEATGVSEVTLRNRIREIEGIAS
ncbi:transcription initiation factor IIB family protein [Candidatus Woesearchaeota archaeon]|nr:transcription initiation factor IIB family protein [Candidatus Woesearchaeota archaeon]